MCSHELPTMSQVQQMRQRFEQLEIPKRSLIQPEKLQKTPAPVIKTPKPMFGFFKRSKTSIEIVRKCEEKANQDKNDKDLLNKCLKRSPAFRFNQDRTRASIHSHPSASSPKKQMQTFQNVSDEVEYLSNSETIKKALSKPLPVGLPPKKPPRVFSGSGSDSGRKNSVSSSCSSSSTTPNKDEAIYMQPFAHLGRQLMPKPKMEPEELHYMCTDLDTGRSELTVRRLSSLQAAHDSFEKSSIEKVRKKASKSTQKWL